MLSILAAAAPAASSAPAAGNGAPSFVTIIQSPFFILILMLGVMWLFMIRSKKTEERKRQEMLGNLKKGDRVQSIGGILGTVVEARDTEVVVKVDESTNTKIRFVRSAIQTVLTEEKATANK